MAEKINVNQAICKCCKFCITYCPKDAISLSGKLNKKGYEYVEVDEGKCICCGTCYTVCPEIAFTITEA